MAKQDQTRQRCIAVTHAQDFPVVALVCSAGGRLAVVGILEKLPADFPGAVIVLQHQSPETQPVLLARLLMRYSALPVTVASDRMQLGPGRVIIAPPGHHLLVTLDGHITLIEAGAIPPNRPSADLLLTSLALGMQSRSIAVVLSGTGRDGATGASVVHRFGGTVIASDEATSEYFGMPSEAISRDESVDHVLPLDAIAPMLCTLADRRDARFRTDLGSVAAADRNGDQPVSSATP